MKKQTLIKSLLILFPVLAVGLATTVDSVMVFDTLTGETDYFSYFDQIPVDNLQTLPFMAALCALVSGILAAVYLGKKNLRCLKAAGYAAFAAAVLACIPILIRGEMLVVPNVAFPIFMLGQYLAAAYAAKQPEASAKGTKAPRLKKR